MSGTAEPAVEPDGDAQGDAGLTSAAEAPWRTRAVERSLRGARARAASRSDRFLAAATELLSETGGTDFTVQELVLRAGLSLRAFYQHFASKDELVLALFEEAISAYVDTVRAKVDQLDDPVDQLRLCVFDLYDTAEAAGKTGTLLPHAFALYHQRLAGTQPAEVARALGPQVELVCEIVERGAATGSFRTDIEPGHLATILSQTLIAVGHMNVLGTHVTGVRVGPEDLWSFCWAGVGRSGAAR
jgi:AcrR family transcriptional regulator